MTLARDHRMADDLVSQANLAAPRNHAARHLLPHLARAKLRVEELLDQAGLDVLLGDVAAAPAQALSACPMALLIDRPLTRCAPHSALISLHGTPQTFSV